ncbi:MAG: stage III sporulation protein AA [Clostridiales bacterium]|nr:stage III sporulation protein AA [Clostridiales bacterium]
MKLDEDLIKIFPLSLLEYIKKYLINNKLQEIRVKENKPCILFIEEREVLVDYIVKKEDIKFILQKISNFSLYAFEEDIKQGFITIKGGHRVGLAGECVMESGKIKTIKNICSMNIRICREVIGCSNKVIRYISENNSIKNTLIIAPPKCGKTTILRDMARNISGLGKKVTIVDERSEIAACYMGVPQMDVGIRTDVLDNCLKSEGMIMAIRSLSPEVIICDEIGTKKDIESLIMAFNSGVKIIITLHGFTINDFFKRIVFKELIENYILDRIIVLSSKNGVGTIEGVYKVMKGEADKCLKLC